MAKKRSTDTRQDILAEDKVKEPGFYRVLLHNDDYTTMEFVVNVLVSIFNMTIDSATSTMLAVHKKGKAIAGRYTREIAETKVDQVTKMARQNKFPLKTTMEEE